MLHPRWHGALALLTVLLLVLTACGQEVAPPAIETPAPPRTPIPTPDPSPAGPALTIDAADRRHPISPLIYGINFAEEDLAAELRLPLRRWGGNATTRYNWKIDTANRAKDWFFENIPEEHPDPATLPAGSSLERFIEQDRRTGTATLLTIPLIGWTPKSREIACGFSVEKYGPQQEVDPWRSDCGNGVRPDGTPISGNDPTDTSMPIGPDFVQEWIAYLVERYGGADAGGVRFYNLDNEPELWHVTHRDVFPEPLSYAELRERTVQYAAVLKASDPAAQTLGPAAWGWPAYFFSARDIAAGAERRNTGPDRQANGNLPLAPWYLQQLRAYEAQHGVRLLDYFDLHFYPQAPGVALAPAGDAATQARRLRSTRALWDSDYADESWISRTIDGPTVALIPRMRAWIEAYYPGTKLAITEYNWGGLESLNGALAQADALGIFGREGLDLAALWAPLRADQPWAFAFRMYRNYDGAGGQFGDVSLAAQSADPDRLAVYAAQRSADGALTLLVINKTAGPLRSALRLEGVAPGTAQVYRYSAANLDAIVREADMAVAGPDLRVSFPASSITLLVLEGVGVALGR